MPALPIQQQVTFLDTRDLARTADFYERVLVYNGFAHDPNGYLIEIQRFWELLV